MEQELRKTIENTLKRCGIYYRLFSRVKAPASLEHKYELKIYDETNHIQDLIGFRINVYFEEDLEICQELLKKVFVIGPKDWELTDSDVTEFEPSKINGVFYLPKYLVDKISKQTWDYGIDPTVEIQIKTVLFEGWHEIEHDMRYKNKALWKQNQTYGRKFNSILATLELCDHSITQILEDFAHQLYTEGKWEDMIRLHYRVKMTDSPIIKELDELLKDKEHNRIAKQLFKTPKRELIKEILRYNTDIILDVNTIIALMNEHLIHNEDVSRILAENKISLVEMGKPKGGYKGTTFQALTDNLVGRADAFLDTGTLGVDGAFREASQAIREWAKERYRNIFPNISDVIEHEEHKDYGYGVRIECDDRTHYFFMETTHLDSQTPNAMWVTQAKIWEDKGNLHITVSNRYKTNALLNPQERVMYFSLPGFYMEICWNVGVLDVIPMKNECFIVKTEANRISLSALLQHQERRQPVVVICVPSVKESTYGVEWIDDIMLKSFTREVWRYAHVCVCEVCKDDELHGKEGIYLYPTKELIKQHELPHVCYYSREQIKECDYDHSLGLYQEMVDGKIVNGEAACFHQLVDMLKCWNVGCVY
ncbi:MAG: hypothetical protein NC393_12155 [Clostridium sp.]|nr:hypothetical protein [Clostridium sp.]